MTQAQELIRALETADQPTRKEVADNLMTPGECARLLDVSASTFLWWVKNADDFPKPFKDYDGKKGLRPLYWYPDVALWRKVRQELKGKNATD